MSSGREPRDAPPLPRPRSVAAQTPEGMQRPARPPLGVTAWAASAADADALAVFAVLEAAAADDRTAAEALLSQIPSPEALRPGTLVVLMPEALRPRGLLGPLLGPRREPLSVAARATALLARGFEDIGAGRDGALLLTWGYAPLRPAT